MSHKKLIQIHTYSDDEFMEELADRIAEKLGSLYLPSLANMAMFLSKALVGKPLLPPWNTSK